MEIKRHPLFQDYCNNNPGFVNELEGLPQPYRDQFIQRFNRQKDKVEFLSLISELKFVKFFIAQGLDVEYEPKVLGKLPDLRIKVGNKDIIGDVKRFNLSEEDQTKSTFFYELATTLRTIQEPYHIRVIQFNDFIFHEHNVQIIKSQFQDWLTDNKQPGSVFNYYDLFHIKVMNKNSNHLHVIYSYRTFPHKIHPHKIVSLVKEKVLHYKNSIIDKGCLFFICIDLLFDSMIMPMDFTEKFRGIGVYDIDNDVESTDLGEFYKTEEYKNVLGILVQYNGEFYWTRNFREMNYFSNEFFVL